ncbi:MAG: MBL fold metallo-hydrolase [Polyangiaceae bacterium]
MTAAIRGSAAVEMDRERTERSPAMQIKAFYDAATYTLTFVVYDERTRDAVVIDPVLDYDALGATTATKSVEEVAAFIRGSELKLHYVLETHAHADHLSASQWLKKRFGAKVAIGAAIRVVQETFKGVFDLGQSFKTDGSQFDQLLEDGQVLRAGALAIEVISTPGHTPACLTFKIEDAIFTGDALFMDDYGTGRCDFPRGSASDLYDSIQKLYKLPDATRVFVGHDYQPGGRPLAYETTIQKSKEANIQLRASTDKESFVNARQTRDATLTPPRLLFPSVQVNINAGRLPKPHDNGMRYLVIPLNMKRPTTDEGDPA